MIPGYLDPSVDSTVELPVDAELYDRVAPIFPRTVISQYANSPRILAMISAFADAMNAEKLSDQFFDSIWNIDTATGFGLDVWGRIVDVQRSLYVPGGQTGESVGFAEAHSSSLFGFGQRQFSAIQTATPNFTLADDDYRRLILVKAFSNISDRSIPTMNKALMQMFAGRGGNVYVADMGGMKMAYVFNFVPTAIDKAILLQSGAFANPSGVALSIRVVIPRNTLGFAEAGRNVGTFATGTFQ